MNIKSSFLEEKTILIPILGTDNFAAFHWLEDETFEDLLKNNSKYSSANCCQQWKIPWIWEDDYEEEAPIFINIYDVLDTEKKEYYLISLGGFHDPESDINKVVCMYHNDFNLLSFYKEFIKPFKDNKVKLESIKEKLESINECTISWKKVKNELD